jgi:hypothetical protein
MLLRFIATSPEDRVRLLLDDSAIVSGVEHEAPMPVLG